MCWILIGQVYVNEGIHALIGRHLHMPEGLVRSQQQNDIFPALYLGSWGQELSQARKQSLACGPSRNTDR